MNKYSLLLAAAICFCALTAKSQANINLAGLVVDAETMAPVDSAKIVDEDNHILGFTDKMGYYKVAIAYHKDGPIHFGLKVVKKGFDNLDQNEHWGNQWVSNNYFYFGLHRFKTRGESFSELGNNTGGSKAMDYKNVLAGFDKVKEHHSFDIKLDAAKAGNENALVKVDGSFYVVDSSGWIKIDSEKELVSIDDKKSVPANQLNATIKRNQIHSMTTVASKDWKVAVYTGNNFKSASK